MQMSNRITNQPENVEMGISSKLGIGEGRSTLWGGVGCKYYSVLATGNSVNHYPIYPKEFDNWVAY